MMKNLSLAAAACLLAGCGAAPSGPVLSASQCREITNKVLNLALENLQGTDADAEAHYRESAAQSYNECVAGKTWINNQKHFDCMHAASDSMAVAKCSIENGGGKVL
jgi:hypothetical protein